MNNFDFAAEYVDRTSEDRLAGGLSALVDRQPPTAVSIEEVVGAGQRGVRRRRGFAVLGTAAAFAAVSVGVWGAVHLSGSSTPVAAAAARGTDPMVVVAEFGWLPGSSTAGFGYKVDPGGDYTVDVENGTVNASLTLQTVGEPRPGGASTPGGTVDGHPAVWVNAGDNIWLEWQYKPGAWAWLLAEGATKAQTTKIADTVKYSAGVPIAMPFHVPSLPAGFTVGGASASRNTQDAPTAGDGSVILCAAGKTCYSASEGLQNDIRIDSYYFPAPKPTTIPKAPLGSNKVPPALAKTIQQQAPQGTTVKIHGVSTQCEVQQVGGEAVAILEFDINGLTTMVQADGAGVNDIGGCAGLARFLNTITWYHADIASWTTDTIG